MKSPKKAAPSGIETTGGSTKRIGSLGWSWWTPWIIQWRRAPSPLLGLEVEDGAMRPVLAQRPEHPAGRKRDQRGDERHVRLDDDRDRDDRGAEDQQRDDAVHAGQMIQRARAEHRRRRLQQLAARHANVMLDSLIAHSRECIPHAGTDRRSAAGAARLLRREIAEKPDRRPSGPLRTAGASRR